MRRIAVINQKGGVGKTTTVASLSAAAAISGRRVLAIDLDPQAHLSLHFGIELRDEQSSAYDVLTASTPIDEVSIKIRDNITLVPADIDLAAAEAELVSIMGREMILREAVDLIHADHDVMLIDCPPSLGVLTINALAAADEVIIPLQAHFFALQGVSKLLDTVTLVRQRINPKLTVAGFALCMHDGTTRLAGEVVADLAQFLDSARGQPVPWADAQIFKTRIRRNIKLAESSSFGQTVFDYAPRSNGAIDYAGLSEEVFGTSGFGATAMGRRVLACREAPPSPTPEVTPPCPPAPASPAAKLRMAWADDSLPVTTGEPPSTGSMNDGPPSRDNPPDPAESLPERTGLPVPPDSTAHPGATVHPDATVHPQSIIDDRKSIDPLDDHAAQ